MTDLTNEELNEAVVLALGWTMYNASIGHVFTNPNEYGSVYRLKDLSWATNAQACLDDLLPAVEEDYSVAFTHRRGEWIVWLETDDGPWREFRAPTLARAICLCFIAVIKP